MREVDILKHCLQISREAYEQELERQKAIGVKADYLMKFYTLLIAILNLSLPLIIQYTQIQNLKAWRYFYILAMGSLLLGIIFTLMIQMPRKVSLSQVGTAVLKEVKEAEDDICQEIWIYKNILRLDKRTFSIEKVNNAAVKWVKKSYIIFTISIVMMGIFFFSVIR